LAAKDRRGGRKLGTTPSFPDIVKKELANRWKGFKGERIVKNLKPQWARRGRKENIRQAIQS